MKVIRRRPGAGNLDCPRVGPPPALSYELLLLGRAFVRRFRWLRLTLPEIALAFPDGGGTRRVLCLFPDFRAALLLETSECAFQCGQVNTVLGQHRCSYNFAVDLPLPQFLTALKVEGR